MLGCPVSVRSVVDFCSDAAFKGGCADVHFLAQHVLDVRPVDVSRYRLEACVRGPIMTVMLQLLILPSAYRHIGSVVKYLKCKYLK